MIKKILKYSISFLFFLAFAIYIYLNQFFGKKLTEKEVKVFEYVSTDTTFKIRYFGTMCYYIEYKGNAILSDPFFSNPNPLKLALGSKPNQKYLNLFSSNELHNIKAILVGHAHYDHCLELPLFLNRPEPATVVANQSTINLFQTAFPENNYIIAENYLKEKKWFYTPDSSIRIYFIDTKHGPHIGNIVFMNGENKKQETPPTCLLKWNCGKSMSYIVDFMEHDTIAKRIVINGGKMSFPTDSSEINLTAGHKTDIVFLLGWNKLEMPDKYASIQCFNSSSIILGHWNNFFNTKKGNHEYIRRSDLPKTLKSLNELYNNCKTTIMLPETLKE